MLRSMTGYGAAEASAGETTISVEIRTLNHKYTELTVKLPRSFHPLDPEIRRQVFETVSRGRIEVFIQKNGAAGDEVRPILRKERAERYYDLLLQLKETLGLSDPIRLEHILGFSDIFEATAEAPALSGEEIALFHETLAAALERLERSRAAEGKRLLSDFEARLSRLGGIVGEIERAVPRETEAYAERLRQRIEELTGQETADEPRWMMEVALLAEKHDVTEEVVRLKGHIEQFGEVLESTEPNGKRLEFIAQEMSREIHTIGMKVNSSEVARRVVAAKNEIARLREQLQNIE